MSEQVRAVRAWAAWDERTGYAYLVQDGSSRNGEWKCTTIPLGSTGVVMDLWSIDSLVEIIEQATEFGLLRSLRVLLSNGQTVRMHWDERMSEVWVWSIWRTGGPEMRGPLEFGSFVDETDAVNVRRALDAAIAWLAGERSG